MIILGTDLILEVCPAPCPFLNLESCIYWIIGSERHPENISCVCSATLADESIARSALEGALGVGCELCVLLSFSDRGGISRSGELNKTIMNTV